MTEDNCRVAFV